VARLNGQIPVIFDSGIRDGRDVLVALVHGASAVLVGRPFVWGLASHGAMGVAHVIRLLRDELEMTMSLTGFSSLAAIDGQALSP
jgi:4-hydroxymandelate oxidase